MDDERHRAPDRRRSDRGGRVPALIIAAIVAVAALLGYRGELPDWVPFGGSANIAEQIAPAPAPPLDPVSVAAAVRPALVNISAATKPFGLGATGSGIALSADGQVLTSHHVVKGADTVTVTDVGNGRAYQATVLGYDSSADIALLELAEAAGLAVARVGSSAGLRVRDEVMAIGNAGGAGGPPTAVLGRITELNSTIVALNSSDLSRKALSGMVEVAAAVSSGQSGGALADRNGEVVGVITAASGDPANAVGHEPNGYAVPIDAAMQVVRQIQSGTPTETVHIGPTATLGVLISDAKPSGARIDVAIYGMPARAAGLTDGEVITSVDGRSVTSARTLRAAINLHKPDDTVRLGVTGTSGKQRTVTAVLVVGPPN